MSCAREGVELKDRVVVQYFHLIRLKMAHEISNFLEEELVLFFLHNCRILVIILVPQDIGPRTLI